MTDYEKTIQEFKLEYINTQAIKIDSAGQRDVEARSHQFKWIMDNFDPRLIQPLTVADIGGIYYCVDGQMTRKVHIAMNHGHLAVPCRVIKCNSLGEAADLFLKQRGLVKAVSVNEKFAVGVNYGEEVENGAKYRLVNSIIENNGFYVSKSLGSHMQNCIVAVSTLINEYDKFGDDMKFDHYLKVLRRAWNGDHDSLQTKVLSALGLFMRVYEGQYDETVLVRKLNKTSPNSIIRADDDPAKGPRKYAQKILYIYNKGRSDSAKLPNLFN